MAYAYDPTESRHGSALNIDASLTEGLLAASLNGKYLRFGEVQSYGAQAEFTFWYVCSYGVGAGYLLGDTSGPILHRFIGFPIGQDHYFVERGGAGVGRAD